MRHLKIYILSATVVLAACSNNTTNPPIVDTVATTTPSTAVVIQATATPLPTEDTANIASQPLPTQQALPTEIVDEHGIVMLLVPAGEFIMGAEFGFHDELPVRTVYLDDFYMDMFEITNAAYAECVDDGVCVAPRITGSRTRFEYFGVPEYDNFPAVYLSWTESDTYCNWRGARLPTEAEWEKAARGTDGRVYAWGNQEPDSVLTNYAGSEIWDTTEVGLYPAGVSPYGIHDMSGNVYEWVADWYQEDYYEVSPSSNPTGPQTGNWRVTRGGSFFNFPYRIRIANRNNAYLPPDSIHNDGGARCARSPL